MKDEQFASQMKSLKVGVLRKKAESLNKRGRFKEAAEIYLTIYRNFQEIYDDQGMCEVLFNTAINMEAGRLVMPAIRVRERMIEDYPECEHSKKAAYYIGQNYHALQIFPLAAEHYMAFAKRYPGEEESPEAVSNAIMFYIGLGEYEQAWSAVKKFIRFYQATLPEKTASVFFSAGHIYLNDARGSKRVDVWEPVRKHYLKYLRKHSGAQLVDEQVQAHVFIADSYWFQRPRDLERAEKYYNKALKLFDQNAMAKVAENKRKADMLNAAASARFIIADRKFTEFKKIRFPAFNPEREVPERIAKWWRKKVGKEEVERFEEMRKYRRMAVNWGEMERKEANQETKKEDANIQFEYWLEHRFKPWMERKTAALEAANALFSKVVDMHVPEWEMAAAARAGDMQIQFMSALYDAPLPPAFKGDEELTTIYRQSMDEKAQPFRDVAIKLYEHCLTVSTKVRWFNENSKRCEAELNKLDPNRYPVSDEIRIQPDNEIVILDIPGPILERPTLAKKKEQQLKDSTEQLDAASPAPEPTGDANTPDANPTSREAAKPSAEAADGNS
jgi:tetratricopeptide (TPR) repeat protein